MSHNTGNELESSDILDFSDNCENLDVLMNADQEYWTDRLGNKRPTIDYALRMVGFTPAGFDFTTGGVLKNGDRNKCVFNQADQTWYSWSGDLPYNVIAGSVPGEGWKVWDKNAYVIAREGLSRTYGSAGYEVKGSFITGAQVESGNDILIAESTGKGYAYIGVYPHVIAHNETPASPGWVDKSIVLTDIAKTTVSIITSGFFPAGRRVCVIDRANAMFDIVQGGVPNGFDVIDAGNGNTAKIVLDGWMAYEAFGVDADGLILVDAAMARAHATGHKYFYAKPNARYLHGGDPCYLTSGTRILLGNAKFTFAPGTYNKYMWIYRTNTDIVYNPATPRLRDIKIFGGEVDGNVNNVTINSTFGASVFRAQCVDGAEWYNPKIYNMPGSVGALPAIDFHFSNDCYVHSPDINNTDRQGIMFWESKGKVYGGKIIKSRFREPIIASSEDVVAYQGSNVIIESVHLDNVGTTDGTHVIRFSGKSDGKILRCKLYGRNTAMGVPLLNGVYITFALPHNVTIEDCDIYNCTRGLEIDTTGDIKDIKSINNRFWDCDRPLHAIFGGARSSFSSKGDKCYGVTDRPFSLDYVSNVTINDFYAEGGSSFGFINNFKKLNINDLELSGCTASSYSLNIGIRSGLILPKVNGLKIHDNTANIATVQNNILGQDNDCTFAGPGLRLSKIGRSFIWATGAGVLRISNVEPTLETDGTIVGTQS